MKAVGKFDAGFHGCRDICCNGFKSVITAMVLISLVYTSFIALLYHTYIYIHGYHACNICILYDGFQRHQTILITKGWKHIMLFEAKGHDIP